MSAWLQKLAALAERVVAWSGRIVSWLIVAIVLLVSYDVAMRYLFHSGSVAVQELEWHLFSLIFLLGAGYTLQHDAHVRVDLLYRSRLLSDRQRLWIDVAGTLLLLIPFCTLVVIQAWPFVVAAFRFAEHSPDPGGLGRRWMLKAAIPLGFVLLLVQAAADLVKKLRALGVLR